MPEASSTSSRIENLNKRLQSRRRQTNFTSTLTLLIGLAAIGALSFYFYYGYTQFQEILNPKMLVGVVTDELKSHLPELRETAAKEIRSSAPQWAEELSNEIIKQMPTARQELEKQLREYLDGQLRNAKTITEDKFREMVQQNRGEVKEAIDTILSDKDSEAFIAEFMPVVEKSVGIEFRDNAAEALGAFGDLNEKLERLAKGENLSDLEKQQRYVLGLVQRLRLDHSELK